MYLHKDEAKKLVKEFKFTLAKDLVDKMDHLSKLLDSDDWNLIVKSYTLIEKVITDLIISKIEEPRLKNIISRLPLADEEIGKLRITKEYDLLTAPQIKFINRLAALRNKLVHDFEYANFQMDKYISSLDKNQTKEFHKSVIWFSEDAEARKQWVTISQKTPIIVIWFSIFMFISKTIIKEKEYLGKTEISKQKEITSDELLKVLMKK